jgi:protocatechuate 3,4-dioxygenase beta subunit
MVGTLRVRIVDAETSTPLKGANVGLDHANRAVDANGEIAIPDVRTGTCRISGWKPGYLGIEVAAAGDPATVLCSGADHRGRPFEITAGILEEGIVIRMKRGPTIRGSVIDPDGAPLAGARVVAKAEHGLGQDVETDGDGRFRLPGLQTGDYEVVATHPRWGYAVAHVALPPSGAELALRLVRTGRVTGVVVDSEGRALAGVRVDAIPTTGKVPVFPDRSNPFGDEDPLVGRRVSGTTDDAGRFSLEVRPDVLDVIAWAAGYRAEVQRVVDVKEGKDAKIEIKLSPGGTITGRVVDRNGAPVATTGWVTVQPRGLFDKRRVDYGQDGTFRIDALVEGLYDLTVCAYGNTLVQVKSVRPGADLVVTAVPNARIVGRLVVPKGAPMPRVIRCMGYPRRGGGGSIGAVDEAGHFELERIEHDAERVVLSVPGYREYTIDRGFAPGARIGVTVHLEPGAPGGVDPFGGFL